MQATAQSGRTRIPMHYERAELPVIIQDVARATGRRFVYDSDLDGRVTITVPGRVSQEEALELLFAALFLNDLTALPSEGGTIRIVPIIETLSSAPVEQAASLLGGRPITTLIGLDHVSAERAAETLRPYVSRNGLVLAYAPANSLILAGTEGQVVRWITIARMLDAAAIEEVLVRTIRYRDVEQLAAMLEIIFNQGRLAKERVTIASDTRSSRIIIEGNALALIEIRRFIENFDRPVEGEGLIHVVRILNRDAEQMASLLTGLADSTASPASGPSTSRRAQPQIANTQKLMGRDFKIDVDGPTQSLLIRADPETLALLLQAISELDRLPPRVSVEVIVLEMRRPESFVFGLNYFLPLSTPSSPTDFAVFTQSGRATASQPVDGAVAFGRYVREPVLITLNDPILGTITIPVPREDVSIEAGETTIQTNVLIRPNIVGISGEEHEIFVGDNIPIPSARTASADSGQGNAIQDNPLNVTQNIERVDVGARLLIKPTIREDGNVRLDLDLELSRLVESLAGDIEVVGPTYADTELQTTFELRPSERAVIGARNGAVTVEKRVGIPWLMNIPGLGWLFSSIEERTDENDLIIVVEARVLLDADDAAAETLRRQKAFERAISRSADLGDLGENPYAILLETARSRSDAEVIAQAFRSDGFSTEVKAWDVRGERTWDVYITELSSFEEAGRLARRLSEGGWTTEITVLPAVNELAGD
ncbi:MAG: secretin N-terminal domain-containing protein [Myxococcota bacterium]|nr:secretin N-terminal domain-containing protein [Myxococcota bacterium]